MEDQQQYGYGRSTGVLTKYRSEDPWVLCIRGGVTELRGQKIHTHFSGFHAFAMICTVGT